MNRSTNWKLFCGPATSATAAESAVKVKEKVVASHVAQSSPSSPDWIVELLARVLLRLRGPSRWLLHLLAAGGAVANPPVS